LTEVPNHFNELFAEAKETIRGILQNRPNGVIVQFEELYHDYNETRRKMGKSVVEKGVLNS
jgi:hypothetical protein